MWLLDSLGMRLKRAIHHAHLGELAPRGDSPATPSQPGIIVPDGMSGSTSDSLGQAVSQQQQPQAPALVTPPPQQTQPARAVCPRARLSQLHAEDLQAYDAALEEVAAAAAAAAARHRRFCDGFEGGMHQPMSRISSWVEGLPDMDSPDSLSYGPDAAPALSTASHSWHDPAYEAAACDPGLARPSVWASDAPTLDSDGAYGACCVKFSRILAL